MTKGNDGSGPKFDVSRGLDGLFKGLGNLLELATDLAGKAESVSPEAVEARQTGATGNPKGMHAVYGVSVRIGPRGAPVVGRFGNVRRSAAKAAVVDDVREPIADLLDEDGFFLVIAELPGIKESAVRWSLEDDILVIRAECADRKYRKELLIPLPVDQERIESSYNNGVLELKLWKADRT